MFSPTVLYIDGARNRILLEASCQFKYDSGTDFKHCLCAGYLCAQVTYWVLFTRPFCVCVYVQAVRASK